jgi:hypothetical protein
MRRIGGAAGERQLRHRGDRGQRLAPEAERCDTLEVRERADLAGGMPEQRKRHLLLRDAAAVVAYLQPAQPAVVDADLDVVGAGVDGVFQQLLDHRRGSFDDFTRGDLADQRVRQQRDRAPAGWPSARAWRGQRELAGCSWHEVPDAVGKGL